MAIPLVRQAFEELAVQFGLEPSFAEWAVDPQGLGAASVNDFIFAADGEAGIGALVNTIPNVANKLLMTSRLRQTWRALRDATEAQEALKRKRVDDTDLDALLQQQVLDTLQDQFHARYHLTLPPHLAPADALVSRLAKELEKRVLSVRDVWKSRNQEHQLRRQKRRTALTDSLTLVQDEADDDPQVPHTVQCYLELLQTLLFAYSIAGVTRLPNAPQVESRTTDSTTVVQAPLDVLMRYFWRCAQKVQTVPGPRQLTWLTNKDEQERSRWVDVFRNSSMEFGQVVSQVFQQREAMWEIQDSEPPSPKKQQDRSLSGAGKGSSSKGKGMGSGSKGMGQKAQSQPIQFAKAFRDGSLVCAAFNSSRGCALKEACQEKHLCSVILQSGRVCGGRHTAFNHAKQKGK